MSRWRGVVAVVASGFSRICGWQDPTSVAASNTAPPARTRATLLREFVERLVDFREVRRVGLRGAGLAGSRRVHRVAVFPERDALFLLAVVELHRDGQR